MNADYDDKAELEAALGREWIGVASEVVGSMLDLRTTSWVSSSVAKSVASIEEAPGERLAALGPLGSRTGSVRYRSLTRLDNKNLLWEYDLVANSRWVLVQGTDCSGKGRIIGGGSDRESLATLILLSEVAEDSGLEMESAKPGEALRYGPWYGVVLEIVFRSTGAAMRRFLSGLASANSYFGIRGLRLNFTREGGIEGTMELTAYGSFTSGPSCVRPADSN